LIPAAFTTLPLLASSANGSLDHHLRTRRQRLDASNPDSERGATPLGVERDYPF